MSERPKSTGLVTTLLIVLGFLGLGFGGGVLVGRATRPRKPKVTEKREEVVTEQQVRRDLAECKQELRAITKAQVASPARVLPLGVAQDAGPATLAKIETLQRGIHECKKQESLIKAHVCGTADNYINVHFVLVYSSSCTDKAGVGDYLINSYEKCAEFEQEEPEDYEHLDGLTEEEGRVVWGAGYARRRYSKENFTGWVNHTLRECRKRFGVPAPEK